MEWMRLPTHPHVPCGVRREILALGTRDLWAAHLMLYTPVSGAAEDAASNPAVGLEEAPSIVTDLVVTPDRTLAVVDAMLTGFHAPKASHLFMLEALAGHDHLSRAYREAVENRYTWHEFGDVHLILP